MVFKLYKVQYFTKILRKANNLAYLKIKIFSLKISLELSKI